MGEGNTVRYKLYPAYKPSGVEWLGDIPAGWEVWKIKQIARLNPSKNEVSQIPDETSVTFLPMEVIGEYGELDTGRIRNIGQVRTGYTYLGEGDVCIAKITPCFENGKAAIVTQLVNGIAFATTEVIPIRCNERVDSKFLFAVLTSSPFNKLAEGSMYGAGGQKRVSDMFVANYHLALPAPSEQTKIAAFLDYETGKIEGLIAKQERLIELLEEKRQAVISHAVTKGLAPNAPLRPSGIDWLGDVPAHWEVLSLKRVVSLKGGYAFSSESFADIGKRVIRIGDIDTYGNVSLENAKCIPIAMANRFNEYEVRTGHILMAMTGATIGKAGWYLNQEPALLNQRVGAFECDEGHIGSRFFWYILKSDGYQKYVTLTAFGGAQPNISDTQMLSYSIVLPALVEQEMISNFLDSENITFDELTLKAQSAITLLKERRTALISAAVTGKIDVRDWQPPKSNSDQEPISAKDAEL